MSVFYLRVWSYERFCNSNPAMLCIWTLRYIRPMAGSCLWHLHLSICLSEFLFPNGLYEPRNCFFLS